MPMNLVPIEPGDSVPLLKPLQFPSRPELSEALTPGTYQGRHVDLSNVFQLIGVVPYDLKAWQGDTRLD